MGSSSTFTRLVGAGFAALLAAGLLVTLSASLAIQTIRRTNEALVDDYTASLIGVERLRSLIAQRADAGEVYLLTGEARFLEDRRALESIVAREEQALRRQGAAEPARELFQRVLEADAELSAAFARAAALREEAGGEEALRRWEDEVSPVRDRLQGALDALVAHHEERFHRAAAAADRDTARLLRTTVVVGGAALFLASLLALAVTRALVRTRQREELAAAALQREERTQRVLAQTSAALTSSLDVAASIEGLARMAVRDFAEVCVADLREDDRFQRVCVEHRDPADDELARALKSFSPSVRERCPALHVMRTGHSELVANLSERYLNERFTPAEHRRILEALGARSLIAVPVVARGHVVGALTFLRTDPALRYDERDVALAEELGRRAAAALENARLYEASRRAVDARDRVLAIVSHDLKNPLGVVLMCAEQIERALLAPERLAERIAPCATRIRSAGRRMDLLIRDLLDLASLDAGRLALHFGAYAPDELAREALDLLAPLAQGKRVRLTLRAEEPLPEVGCDRERVQQVLGNLLGNALKFVPEAGDVELRVARCDDEVCFAVSDNGPGIPDEQRAHVFERFWRAAPELRQGTGLGLSIAKAIIDAHGGRIWLEPRARGSTFVFTLTAATRLDAAASA